MKKNKRGLSAVVVTLILVLLAVVLTGIVWTVVDKIVNKESDYAKACFNIFEKVKINDDYSCYNTLEKEFQFGIGIADIEVDEVLFSLSWVDSSYSMSVPGSDSSLRYYSGTYGESVELPGENEGKTYVVNVTEFGGTKPDSIEIAPIISGHQCEVSDSLFEIVTC